MIKLYDDQGIIEQLKRIADQLQIMNNEKR